MNIVDKMRAENLRTDLPDFAIGDTVNVGVRIVEGNKTRTQNFMYTGRSVIARMTAHASGDRNGHTTCITRYAISTRTA